MNDLNLILRFRPDETAGVEVRSAARISIDGSGTLILHPPDHGPAERIDLSAHLLSIHSIHQAANPGTV